MAKSTLERVKGDLSSVLPRFMFWRDRARSMVLLIAILVLAHVVVTNEVAITDLAVAQQNIDHSKQTTLLPPILTDHKTGFERNVTLYTELVNAGEKELRTLLIESLAIKHSSIRDETLFAIGSRFGLINPQQGIDEANELPVHQRKPLIKGIFSEWSGSNLDTAVAAASNLDRDSRLTALAAIANVRDDLSDLKLQELASDLGHPDFVAQSNSKLNIVELSDDPITAWNTLVHDGLDDASQVDSFVLLAESMIEQQGLDALFQLRIPFSEAIRHSEFLGGRGGVFGSIVDAIVRNDPQTTWTYIENGFTETADSSAQSTNQQFPNEVSRRERAHMTNVVQRLLLASWAIVDPASVNDRIEQLPNHLQPLACEQALPELARTEPERTVELVQTLKNLGASQSRTLRLIVAQWSSNDPSSAIDWVLSSPDIQPESLDDILKPALYSLVVENPTRALEIAAQQPNSSRLEAFVISELALSDLDRAIELLPSVSQPARHLSTLWVADNAIELGDVDRALELVIKLEESSEEIIYWSSFFWTWCRENPVQLFERLDELPQNLRQEAARELDSRWRPELTQEQLDYVRTLYDKN